MPILERRNLWTVHPACAEPAEGKDDFVQDDEGHGSPVRGGSLLARRKGGDDHVDQHAEAAPDCRPEHHCPTANLLNEPDRRIRGNGERRVEDTSEDARKKG